MDEARAFECASKFRTETLFTLSMSKIWHSLRDMASKSMCFNTDNSNFATPSQPRLRFV